MRGWSAASNTVGAAAPGVVSFMRAVIVGPTTSTSPSSSRGTSAARYSRMWPRGLVVGHAVGALDRAAVREPEAQQQPAVDGGVHGERLRRERDRVTRIRGDDRRAELDPRHLRPGDRQHRERVEAGALGQPHRREALVGDGAEPRRHLVERCVLLRGEEHANFHGGTLAPLVRPLLGRVKLPR